MLVHQLVVAYVQSFGSVNYDRCQCPHWGYVFKGKMTARCADRDEVFEVGDAFYIPPGHVPVKNEPGTEFLWFSPSEELRTAEAVMMKNMQAMQDGSTLLRRGGARGAPPWAGGGVASRTRLGRRGSRR